MIEHDSTAATLSNGKEEPDESMQDANSIHRSTQRLRPHPPDPQKANPPLKPAGQGTQIPNAHIDVRDAIVHRTGLSE